MGLYVVRSMMGKQVYYEGTSADAAIGFAYGWNQSVEGTAIPRVEVVSDVLIDFERGTRKPAEVDQRART